MRITRQKLYAMGEPLGDSATRGKPCGGRIMGEGGSSSSSSSTDQRTINTDKRIVADNGASATSIDLSGNSNTIKLTDNGAVKAALAANSHGLDVLVAAGEQILQGQQQANQLNTQLAQSMAGTAVAGVSAAYADATNAVSGNKTIIIMAAAIAAAAFVFKAK